MALVSTDWQVTVGKSIEYIGAVHGVTGAGYVTVLELHRWLQDLADAETISGDDFVAITVANPTDKKFDTIIQLLNGFVLGTAGTGPADEYIYGGTIIQGSGGTEVVWDGISVISSPGVVVNVIQNNTVITNDFWNNIPFGTGVNGINPDSANGLAMQFMVKVKTAGAFTDNGSLIFTTREWGKTFSEFRIPATGRGKNSVPLTFVDDLNNATTIGTIAALADVTNTEGYRAIDVDNNTVNENYYSEWDRGANSINTFYERMKWITRAGYTTSIYGIPGEKFRGITHEVAVTTPRVSTIAEATLATWTGGSGQVLARDSAATATKVWIQLLTGVAPTAGQLITVGAGSVTAAAGTPSTGRSVATPMCGASTGSSLVGAYGFSLQYADLAVSDKITALDAVTRQPPNNVTFTVNGIQSGWRILVGPDNGGAILETQLSNSGLVSGAAVTTITVTEAIPANTPASTAASGGVTHLRIKRANGEWTRHAYTARSGSGPSTFTIASTNFSTNNIANGADIYIAYIDAASAGTSVSFNTIQSGGAQTLYVSARFGGTGPTYADSIKPASTTGSLGTTGGSASVSSVSDA